MPKVANVALFFILIAGFSFARGQTAPPDTNVPVVATGLAPAAPAATCLHPTSSQVCPIVVVRIMVITMEAGLPVFYWE